MLLATLECIWSASRAYWSVGMAGVQQMEWDLETNVVEVTRANGSTTQINLNQVVHFTYTIYGV
jgi:hypothetical protein